MLEILIVVIVIGIVSFITIGPGYKRTFEREKALEGVNTLQLIYNAQKRYHFQNNKYYFCNGCTPAELNDNLGILINRNYFNYSVEAAGDGYTAAAKRTDGICKDRKISLTSASSNVIKECDAWK